MTLPEFTQGRCNVRNSPLDQPHFWHHLQVWGSPRPPSDLIIHCKDSDLTDALKLMVVVYYSEKVQVPIRHGRDTQGRIKEDSKLGPFSFLFPVESRTVLTPLGNDVYSIHGVLLTSKGPLSLGVKSQYVDIVKCSYGWLQSPVLLEVRLIPCNPKLHRNHVVRYLE